MIRLDPNQKQFLKLHTEKPLKYIKKKTTIKTN